MSLLSKHLREIKRKKQAQVNESIKIHAALNEFHHSLLDYLHSNIEAEIKTSFHGANVIITISTFDYVFYIYERLFAHKKMLNIIISEDSSRKKIKIALKYNEKKRAWYIQNLSYKKYFYITREFKVGMIEKFMVMLLS